MKIFIFTLGRIYLQCCEMFVARSCRAGLLGVVDAEPYIYYVFSIFKGNSKNYEHQMHLTNPWRGNICMLYVDINLLPSQQ
jgi:hypothetical protein